MSAFDNFSNIRRVMAMAAGEQVAYPSWPDDFARQNSRDMVAKLKEAYGTESMTGLSADECERLDFGQWDEGGLKLIPIWLYEFLHPEDVLTSISGKQIRVADNYKEDGPDRIDNDHRAGCLAFGFIPTH